MSITTAADDILFFYFVFCIFQRKQFLAFYVNCLKNSHGKFRIFSTTGFLSALRLNYCYLFIVSVGKEFTLKYLDRQANYEQTI